MKKTLLTFAFMAMASASLLAQGSINPLNGNFTRVMVDLNGDGVGDRRALASDGGTFSVYWGPAGSNPENLLGTMTIGSTEGIMVGLPAILPVPNAGDVGTVISLQIVAGGQFVGRTEVKQVTLAAGAGPGTVTWSSTPNANRFSPLVVTIVPEPSTIALGVLGLGSLLLFRRRK
jgi:hypothetical protein